MFATDDVTLPDDLGQVFPDDYGRLMPGLDFSSPLGTPEPFNQGFMSSIDSGTNSKHHLDYDGYTITPLPKEAAVLPPPSPKRRGAAAPRTTLRTSRKPEATASKPRVDSTASSLTETKRSVRKSHNQVEKKYRDRLNDQFEQLLAVLAVVSPDQDGEGLSEDGLRSPSKSAVLGLARRRLLTLEKENRMLTAEVERLGAVLQRFSQG